MRTGEAVIDNSGWAERILPPAIVGIVVFLFTRVVTSLQFEKKLTELEKKQADFIEKSLRDFNENKVAPLRERVSKFDQSVLALQHDLSEVKLTTARIAEKLDVKTK